MSMKLSEELSWRGFVNQTTLKDIKQLDEQKQIFYWGCDPSSDSLQIGNLAGAMMAKTLIRHGYKPVILIGGATGMIGDPKDNEERQLKALEEIKTNKKAIAAEYSQIFEGTDFELVDNYDWFKDMGYLEFLRDIGKQFSMTQLLDRDFVQSRIGQDGVGISYAEFSYSLIQGYDFLHLFRKYGVTLQIGGSDQWGNMISGVPLIRKLENAEVHVCTLPLVINNTTGRKFGKSEDGTVWLSAKKTSPYKFYQFWLNVDDKGVGDYLKIYTEIQPKQYDQLMKEFQSNPSSRVAQKYLAYEVTKLIHGAESADTQVKIAEALFSGQEISLSDDELHGLTSDFPVANVSQQISSDDLLNALTETQLASSRSEARRFLQSGAVYLNNIQIKSHDNFEYNSSSRYTVLRRGKNSVALLKVK